MQAHLIFSKSARASQESGHWNIESQRNTFQLKLPDDNEWCAKYPNWALQVHQPFFVERGKMDRFQVWRSCASVRRDFQKQLCPSHPKKIPAYFNDYWTNSRTMVPWKMSNQLGEGPGLRNRLTGSEFLQCIPMLALETHRSSNVGFGTAWKLFEIPFSCFDTSLKRASECAVNNHSNLSISSSVLRAFSQLFWFQGTSVLESVT